MRILITGATGLVGSHISELCREKGIEVNFLTTSQEKIKSENNYQGYFWNPRENNIDERAFKNVDAILHLAGATIAKRWTDSYKKKIIRSRVKTAGLIFTTLKNGNYKIPHFVSASAIGIYPSSLEKLYFEDEQQTDDSFLAEAVEKWEAAANQFKELDMKVAKVRIGLVLAKEGGALKQLIKPTSLNLGAALGKGKQWQSWIHIEDLAGIFVMILEKQIKGTYNAVAPSPVTNEELTYSIAEQMDKTIWLPNVPAVALKTALGEMSTVVLSSQLVSSDKIEKSGYTFKYKNIAKALSDLL